MKKRVKVNVPNPEAISLSAYHPMSGRIKWLLIILFSICSAGFFYTLGGGKISLAFLYDKQERNQLQIQLREKQEQLAQRDFQIKKLTREAQVDVKTYEHGQQILRDMQLQIQKQEEELAFYRKLLALEETQSGVDIKDFSVRLSVNEGEYYYDFLLMQSSLNKKAAKGNIRISIDGMQDDMMRRIEVSGSSTEATDLIDYSFRYFQRYNGVFKLPENFYPEVVHLSVIPSSQSMKKFKHDYSWQELINGS